MTWKDGDNKDWKLIIAGGVWRMNLKVSRPEKEAPL